MASDEPKEKPPVSPRRTTPLITAVRNKDSLEVELLLQTGSDPNENAVGDATTPPLRNSTYLNGPLHWACRCKEVNIARILLDHGASVFMEGENGQNPLHIAHSCADLMKLLLERGASVFAEDSEKRTPLLIASAIGTSETMKLLIDAGALIQCANSQGRTPLHYAQDSLEKCKLLLDNSATLEATDESGKTPLFYVKRLDVAHALVDAGAKLDVTDKKGNQVLHYVLKKCKSDGKSAIVSLLIEKGAPVNAANKDGETPLYIACAEGDGFIGPVEMLVKKGANVNAKPTGGVSAFMKALAQGYNKVALILVKNGASVQDQDENGNTGYHYCAKSGSVNLMVTLFRTKTHDKINAQNNDGETALHWAVASKSVNVISFLLANGAVSAIKDNKGKHALDIAKESGNQTIIRIVELHHKEDEQPPLVMMAKEDAPEGDPSHLVFNEGDLIQVLSKPYEEWWKGALVSKPEKTGLFCSLMVDDQPLDADEARAAIAAGGRASYQLPAGDCASAVDELEQSARIELGAASVPQLSSAEKTVQLEHPDIGDDVRKVAATLKVALAKKAQDWDSSPPPDALQVIIAAALANVQIEIDILEFDFEADDKKQQLEEHKDQIDEWKSQCAKFSQVNAFSTRLLLKLAELVLAFKVAHLSLESKSADCWAKACACIQLMGQTYSIPGTAFLGGFNVSDKQQQQLKKVNAVFSSITTIGNTAASLAHALVERYEIQLQQLQSTGACSLADGVVLLIREYLQDDCPPNPDLDTIVPSLVNAVIFAKRSSSITRLLKQNGIACVPSPSFGKCHSEWNIDGILRKTGILTQQGRKYIGLFTRADLYGYRHGTVYEADALSMARQGEEKTIGPRRKRIVSLSAIPAAPPAPFIDAAPGSKPRASPKSLIPQSGSYWLRKQAELADRLLALQVKDTMM
ncbi:uncharacterized protein LOC134176635 [Corticium candelabrum]|uniref:uncharacterized protein LOC134176635 n=1 Tax=Corticium candelabrum TaxID=121492 RepID=UPI002E254354|nr:uncharacterized protein LOC134176635 [Corticium candelabrum]